MQNILFSLSIFITALVGMLFPDFLPWVIVLSLAVVIYSIWVVKKKSFNPQCDSYKVIKKLKKKHTKEVDKKQQHIYDQIRYIEEEWGYTKVQQDIIKQFIEQRAYSEMYNFLTASLLPQMITLIDYCNDKEKKGCKREVSKRIKELTILMKEELKKKKMQKSESYETTLEVYDHLLSEVK